MKKIISLVFLMLSLSVVYGQHRVIPQPKGNGPVLAGMSIVDVALAPSNSGAYKEVLGRPGYNRALLSFSFNGTATNYKYNGKTYKTIYTGDCPAQMFNVSDTRFSARAKITVVISINGKTYTKTEETGPVAGVCHFYFDLDKHYQHHFITLKAVRSITVEAIPDPHYEKKLDERERCLKLKEKEKEAKELAEKEAKNPKQKKEDDFWAGGEETKLTLVASSETNKNNTTSKNNTQESEENKEGYSYSFIHVKVDGGNNFDEYYRKTKHLNLNHSKLREYYNNNFSGAYSNVFKTPNDVVKDYDYMRRILYDEVIKEIPEMQEYCLDWRTCPLWINIYSNPTKADAEKALARYKREHLARYTRGRGHIGDIKISPNPFEKYK